MVILWTVLCFIMVLLQNICTRENTQNNHLFFFFLNTRCRNWNLPYVVLWRVQSQDHTMYKSRRPLSWNDLTPGNNSTPGGSDELSSVKIFGFNQSIHLILQNESKALALGTRTTAKNRAHGRVKRPGNKKYVLFVHQPQKRGTMVQKKGSSL